MVAPVVAGGAIGISEILGLIDLSEKSFSKMSSGLNGVGGGLLNVGNQYEQSLRIIKAGSGASGDALNSLISSYEAIGAKVPNELGVVATVMIDVNTKTGVTGSALESLSEQVLNLSSITSVDAMKISTSFSDAMNVWGVEAKYGGDVLDKFLAISQGTGIGVDTLANQMTRFGPTMSGLGLNFNQSSYLLGNWSHEGVNTELMLGGLRTAVGRMTKEGVTDFSSKFQSVQKNIMAAASLEEASAIAMQEFGSEIGSETFLSDKQAFTEMASTMRKGLFQTEGIKLFENLDESKGSINRIYEESKTFFDKIAILGNNISITFGPIGQKLGDMLGNALPHIDAAVKEIAPALMEAMPSIERFAGIIGSVLGVGLNIVVSAIKYFLKHIDYLGPALASFTISPALGILIYTIGSFIETLKNSFSFLSMNWPLLIPLIIGPFATIISGISFYAKEIGKFFTGMAAPLAAPLAGIELIITGFKNISNSFLSLQFFSNNLSTALDSFISNLLLGFAQIGVGASLFKSSITQSLDPLINYISNFDYTSALLAPINFLREELGLLPVRMESLGYDIMEGLRKGIASKAESLWKFMQGVSLNIPTAVMTVLDTHSPSRVMMGLGSMVSEGLAIGITNDQEKVLHSSEKLSEAVTNPYNNEWLSGSSGSYSDTMVKSRYSTLPLSAPLYSSAVGPTNTASTEINPVINITVNGDGSGANAQDIAERVKLAIQEVFESAARRQGIAGVQSWQL